MVKSLGGNLQGAFGISLFYFFSTFLAVDFLCQRQAVLCRGKICFRSLGILLGYLCQCLGIGQTSLCYGFMTLGNG